MFVLSSSRRNFDLSVSSNFPNNLLYTSLKSIEFLEGPQALFWTEYANQILGQDRETRIQATLYYFIHNTGKHEILYKESQLGIV